MVNRKKSTTHKSTTYKINTFSKMMFEMVFSIVKSDKDPLTTMLLHEQYSEETANRLNMYQFNELIVTMVNRLSVLAKHMGLTDVKKALVGSERIIELKKMYFENYKSNKTNRIAFRISNDHKEMIVRLKEKELNEVIETAIMLYVHELDNNTYEILFKTFSNFCEKS